MDEIITRIEKLINRSDLNDFEKNFLPSIKSYYEKKKLLTPGQLSTLEKIEARYSHEAQALHQQWLATWDDNKKLAFKQIVDYYSNLGLGYYSSITNKVRQNPEYIPTQKEYSAIVENKYAQKYLNNKDAPARFAVGDLVMLRCNTGWDRDALCVIVGVGNIHSWAKGCREYTVSFVEDGRQRVMLEKEMKFVQQSRLDKKAQQAV